LVYGVGDELPPACVQVNATSRSKEEWSKALSPFYLGPIALYGRNRAHNLENAWQYSKVYAQQSVLPDFVLPDVPPASAVPGSVVGSRSASPAPSLEAILLDRKRRLAAAGAQSSQSTIPISSPIPTTEIRPSNSRMTTPSMKGTRFKSSPLGGFDRHGVVVAEQVKAGVRSQDVSQEDVRIPDDKDKVGPDKMEGGNGS